MGNDCKVSLNLQTICNPQLQITTQCTPEVDITPGTPIVIPGTNYHDQLLNRDNPDQHPISAITNLQESLDALQNGIEAEETRAKSAEESLSDDISAENTRAISAEETLQDNIDAEEERAIRAEQAEANTRSNAISRVEGYISAETIARENADSTLQANINTEALARQNADTTLQSNINAEVLARQNADSALQSNIDAEALARGNADTALNTKIDNHIADKANPHQVTKAQVGLGNVDNTADMDKPISTAVSSAFDAVEDEINDINSKIPNAASSANQLADKDFVNSSISTNTANFIGTFNSVAELEAYSGTLTNNDYAFVVGTDSAGNTVYDRYKYTDATTPASWIFEYELNNSSFTAAQWNAINSGATTALVNQITTNQGNITTIQTTIGGYGNIVTHNVSEFATASQGTKADTAVQPADLATVATSGSYNDLDDKPTIGNATLTIQKNGTEVDTFTANATSDKSINIIVPTDTSDLTNGAGYQTASDVQTAIAGKQDTLVSGTNIKTINSNSILGSGNLNIDGLPSQTGQSGKFLSTDGTNPSWQNVDALPSQTGQSGKYLTTDGTNPSWNTITAPSVDVDGKSITKNASDELQTIGVINQNDTTTALKVWHGTQAAYDAMLSHDANTRYYTDGGLSVSLLDVLYPVGSIYITTNSSCPLSTLIAGSTWVLVGQDRVLQGAGTRGVVGTTLNESLPNIKGYMSNWASNVNTGSATSALYGTTDNTGARRDSTSTATGCSGINFDASRSSSTYQDNAPVQPDAYLVNIFRRIS